MSEKIEQEHNETFNAVSHLAGFVLSVSALVVLVVFAAIRGKPLHVVTFSIYGATLCGLYFSSTMYHFFCRTSKIRTVKIFQRIDHCAIYLLIAGTYTPFCLIVLGGAWGWSLFGAVWGLAALGIGLKLIIKNPDHFLPYSLYGIMGWLAVAAIVPIVKTMSVSEILLLGGGGVSYTLGAILLAKKVPGMIPGIFSYHELWHLFVLLGSILHFALMLFFVLPKY